MKMKDSVYISSSRIGGSVYNGSLFASRASITEDEWEALTFFLNGKLNGGGAAGVKQLRRLLSNGQYEAASRAWKEMKESLNSIAAAQSTIEIVDAFLSKG